MNMQGKRFLVIGGAGLIGSHLVDLLVQEDVAEIGVFDNFSRGISDNLRAALRDPRVKIFESGGDVLHPDLLNAAVKGVHGVFHLAALWLWHCQEYPRSAFQVNIAGTYNVLEAICESNVERLVFSSSASVYGDAVTEPMREDHPYMNTNFYGATKIAGEQLCRSLFHLYRDTKGRFDYVGLRYMNVYGPRQDYRGAYIAVIMKILDRVDQGLSPIVYGNGSQAYDFVYVRDCARANVCAMKANTTDEFYNVGTGIKTSILDLTRQLLEITGSSAEIEFKPEGPTFVTNRVGCPRKAKEQLGFEATTSLVEGLAKLIDWRKDTIEVSES